MLDLTKPLQTRDGRKARIICENLKREYSDKLIVAGIENLLGFESVETYYCNGRYYNHGGESPRDLVNIPEHSCDACQGLFSKDDLHYTKINIYPHDRSASRILEADLCFNCLPCVPRKK
jgi:hypothetical protein